MTDLQSRVSTIIEQRALFYNVTTRYMILKRTTDILISLAGLILLFPLLLITAAIIKLDSPGPVFFIQERSGYKGRIFKMYKFRSMVMDAEQRLEMLEDKNEVSGNMFKMKRDPRVTNFGRFIRKTSIDELPQLFNVLRNDMSIVGPRPPILREVAKYDAWQNLRLSVKPGLTGLWQISGRNDLGFEAMVRLDLKYIRERSFRYDLMIMLKTMPVLLGDSKAY
ncbi:MAG: sugar transferase [Clostridiales bacterium GWC2_40_7]|nr:MAG: sugar transferase [Clostridiales bacterium GWC2_40_7]